MKKYLINIWNWFVGKKELKETTNKVIIENTESHTEFDEALAHLELDKEKYRAIAKCKGCEEEVFVLKLAGEALGYYPNLNRLAVENRFRPSSIYHYWHTKPLGKLYLGKYEIINLK